MQFLVGIIIVVFLYAHIEDEITTLLFLLMGVFVTMAFIYGIEHGYIIKILES